MCFHKLIKKRQGISASTMWLSFMQSIQKRFEPPFKYTIIRKSKSFNYFTLTLFSFISLINLWTLYFFDKDNGFGYHLIGRYFTVSVLRCITAVTLLKQATKLMKVFNFYNQHQSGFWTEYIMYARLRVSNLINAHTQ